MGWGDIGTWFTNPGQAASNLYNDTTNLVDNGINQGTDAVLKPFQNGLKWINGLLTPSSSDLQNPASVPAPNPGAATAAALSAQEQANHSQALSTGAYYGSLGAANAGLDAPHTTSAVLLGN